MLNKLSLAEIKELPKAALANYINELINHDWEYLLYVLYRIDINENQLKLVLAQNTHTNAGILIAESILARCVQAEQNKRQMIVPPECEEERW